MSDEPSRHELTRRTLLGGVAATGAVGAGVGGGTMALFSDTDGSTGNSISAGTLDLVVADSDEGFGDGVSATWTLSNAKPGDTVLADLTLQNAGSLAADHVELGFDVTETEATGPAGSDESDTAPGSAAGMAEQFEVMVMTYDGTNVLTALSDANSNTIVDLDDLVSGNDAVLDDLSPPPAANGGTESLFLQLRWAHDSEFDTAVSGVNNDYQGDELTITVTMALYQDGSQNL